MLRPIIFVLSMMLLSGICVAQPPAKAKRAGIMTAPSGSLSGKITHAATGAPLAGATIYFADLKIGAAANQEGVYFIASLPNGSFLAEVSYTGFSSQARNVLVNGDTKINFSLGSTVVEHGNVTVTGVSKATSIRQTPIPITIINKTALNRSAGTNLIDVLGRLPGVSQVTTGPAISKPFIRGLGYNRLITINDGVRQEGQQWGDEHGVEIDEYSTQKVEILRGPASLMYGSDALAGVINVLTNVPVAAGTIKANFSGSANANNNQLGGFGSVAGNVNSINWNAYASVKKAGDYQNAYDGRVLNSRFREANFGGYAGINKPWGYSHLIFSAFNQRLGLVEGERDAKGKFILYGGTPLEYTPGEDLLNTKEILVPNQHVRHTKIALDNSINMGSGRLSAVVAYQRSQRQEFGNPEAPDESGLWFDLNTINYNLAYHFKDNNSWKSTVGVSGMRQTNRNRGEEVLIPEYDLFDIGIFGYVQKKLGERLNASGGVRFDNRLLDSKPFSMGGVPKFVGFNKAYANVSGSAGLTYAASDRVTLKANAAKGFRAPGVPELAVNGQHEGTNRYEVGELNLKSETSFQFDGGAELAGSHLTVVVNGFYNNISNFIFYGKLLAVNGQDSLIDNTVAFKFNQQDAVLSGLEFTFDLHPHPLDWLHFENTFSFVRGRFGTPVDGSRNLPLIAPARLMSELRAEFPAQLKPLENFYVKLDMELAASQNHAFTGFGTETVTRGYSVFNFGIGSDVVVHGKKVAQFHLALNNLTDATYQSHQSRLKYTAENPVTGRNGIFNMGRNLTARVIVPMEWKVK